MCQRRWCDIVFLAVTEVVSLDPLQQLARLITAKADTGTAVPAPVAAAGSTNQAGSLMREGMLGSMYPPVGPSHPIAGRGMSVLDLTSSRGFRARQLSSLIQVAADRLIASVRKHLSDFERLPPSQDVLDVSGSLEGCIEVF